MYEQFVFIIIFNCKLTVSVKLTIFIRAKIQKVEFYRRISITVKYLVVFSFHSEFRVSNKFVCCRLTLTTCSTTA